MEIYIFQTKLTRDSGNGTQDITEELTPLTNSFLPSDPPLFFPSSVPACRLQVTPQTVSNLFSVGWPLTFFLLKAHLGQEALS